MGRVGEALRPGPRAVGRRDFLCKMDRRYQDIAKPMEVSEDSLHVLMRLPFSAAIEWHQRHAVMQVARSSPAEVFLPKL